MKKRLALLSLILAIALIGAGCSRERSTAEREVYPIYLACDSPVDTVTFYYLEHFGKLLEEKSNGRFKANFYPNGQIGGDADILEGLQNGNVTFVTQTTAPQVNFVPELALFDIPNAFPNIQTARAVLDGPLFENLQTIYAKYGINLYGYADQGFREMSSNRMINTAADFKGIKIRTMENPNHIAYWQAIGANPTPMNFGEVYIGLQQSTIDAQENPLETIVSAKLYEQQDYIVNTNHILHTISLVGSAEIIKDLPEDLQALIPEAAKEATVFARDLTDERTASRLEIIVDSGTEIVELDDQTKADLIEMGQPAVKRVRGNIGDELPDLLKTEVERLKVD